MNMKTYEALLDGKLGKSRNTFYVYKIRKGCLLCQRNGNKDFEVSLLTANNFLALDLEIFEDPFDLSFKDAMHEVIEGATVECEYGNEKYRMNSNGSIVQYNSRRKDYEDSPSPFFLEYEIGSKWRVVE